MEIRYAVDNDLDRVLDLLRTNHVDTISEEEKQNGFVTTNITKEQLCNLMEAEKGITVAEDGDKIVGFALAGSWNFWQPWPLFTYMIEHLKEFELNGETLTVENSYQYGPVCLDKNIVVQVYLKSFLLFHSKVWLTVFLIWLHLSIKSIHVLMLLIQEKLI
ncbi:Uncharacterised protein [Fusobacterium varium]|nr:hypothetical protein [Fusobacterium varium]VEH39570.1 Uncharacterised protein [Fusobacterium varium]